MNAGWDGIAIIWIGLLWPILAPALVYLGSSGKIIKKSTYWLGSILGGYAVIVIALAAIAIVFIPIEMIIELDSLNSVATGILMALCLGGPITISAVMARRCS